MLEKRLRKDKNTFVAFMYFEKTLGQVEWGYFFWKLKEGKIKYSESIFGSIYKEADISQGVREGCLFSPTLSNECTQKGLAEVRKNLEQRGGVKVQEEKIDMTESKELMIVLEER